LIGLFINLFDLLCFWSLSESGCKFTIEEERIVIELQEQFGNKWAKIASYLPGRTDNDVKNFWSSRQKRLARLLKTSSSTTSKSLRNKAKVSSHLPTYEVIRKHKGYSFSYLFFDFWFSPFIPSATLVVVGSTLDHSVFKLNI